MASPPPQDAVSTESANTVAAAVDEVSGGLCPRCDTPYAALQEYCLECGLRLPTPEGTAIGADATARWRVRYPWLPDWTIPVLIALVVAVIGGAVAVWVGADKDDGVNTLVATTEIRTEVVQTATTVVIPTAPEPRMTPPPPRTQPRPRPRPTVTTLATWPPGRRGHTIVLASIPAAAGRAVATRQAREAMEAGLRQVGILDSSKFSSLHPGYYVVFTGIYGSVAEATDALPRVQARGYRGAYPRQVTS
jgi:hypothetical protein